LCPRVGLHGHSARGDVLRGINGVGHTHGFIQFRPGPAVGERRADVVMVKRLKRNCRSKTGKHAVAGRDSDASVGRG
jgi:hypothetical protein